jgi:hypothetical protein
VIETNDPTLDVNTLVRVLTPLTIPMLRDQCTIGYPTGGNTYKDLVPICYNGQYVCLTTDQYEVYRLQVLQYFVNMTTPWYISFTTDVIEDIIAARIREVFENA